MLSAIYLDLDGVVADFHSGWCDLWEIDRSNVDKITSWHLGLQAAAEVRLGYTMSMDQVWMTLEDAGAEWWANLPLLPWANDLVELCQTHAPVVFMTSPALSPSRSATRTNTSCLTGKIMWMEKHFPEITRWAITPVKHHMSHPGALLIDDSTHGCDVFQKHGGEVYLFPRPWSATDWATRDPLAEIAQKLASLTTIRS